jgi:hypothetical protein
MLTLAPVEADPLNFHTAPVVWSTPVLLKWEV